MIPIRRQKNLYFAMTILWVRELGVIFLFVFFLNFLLSIMNMLYLKLSDPKLHTSIYSLSFLFKGEFYLHSREKN